MRIPGLTHSTCKRVSRKKHKMVLGAEADQGPRDPLELLGRAFGGEQIAAQGLENPDGDGLLNGADVGLSPSGPEIRLAVAVTARGSSSPNRPVRDQVSRAPVHWE
jgi:hypothetical protein